MEFIKEFNQHEKYYLVDYTCYNDRCHTISAYILNKYNSKLTTDINEAKIILCVGGDGTLIKTIHEFEQYNLPVLGINAGTVGFLMNSSQAEEIDKIFENDFEPFLIPLQLMKVKVDKNTYFAFNEVMIGGDMSDWITFNINSLHELNGEVKGGGLIFSTAQGSTGINKNNGGSILPLNSNLWSITGDKTSHKIKHVVTPHEINVKATSRGSISLWCDGNKITKVSNEMNIEIDDSYKTIHLAFTYPERFLIKRRDSRL